MNGFLNSNPVTVILNCDTGVIVEEILQFAGTHRELLCQFPDIGIIIRVFLKVPDKAVHNFAIIFRDRADNRFFADAFVLR